MTGGDANGGGQLLGGLDLGGTKIQAVVVDGDGTVHAEARRATPTAGGPVAIVDELSATLGEALDAMGSKRTAPVAVGVGAPGAVDSETGVLAYAPNLSGWDSPFPLGDELASRVGAPVTVGNDVGVAVDAEFRIGAGRPFTSMVGIWWGTGVGGGIVLDGARWSGRGAAGELGHMVVKLGGRTEPKGLEGTIEAYAGRAAMEARARRLVEKGAKTSLFRLMEKKGKTRLASGVWAKALEQGDPMAVQLVDEAVQVLGAGAASVVNLLDVEAVVIGGGLGTRLGQPYAGRIAGAMAEHLFRPEAPPAVLAAELGDLGGAIGAAFLAASRTPARGAPVAA
jgi:glucokinase